MYGTPTSKFWASGGGQRGGQWWGRSACVCGLPVYSNSHSSSLARFPEPETVTTDLFPCFKDYSTAYIAGVKSCPKDSANVSRIMERQKAYDVYGADHDPATGMFGAVFGKE